jgi:hypothetical protein
MAGGPSWGTTTGFLCAITLCGEFGTKAVRFEQGSFHHQQLSQNILHRTTAMYILLSADCYKSGQISRIGFQIKKSMPEFRLHLTLELL